MYAYEEHDLKSTAYSFHMDWFISYSFVIADSMDYIPPLYAATEFKYTLYLIKTGVHGFIALFISLAAPIVTADVHLR